MCDLDSQLTDTQQESQQSHLSEVSRLLALERNSHNFFEYVRMSFRHPPSLICFFGHDISDTLSTFWQPKRLRRFDSKISHLPKRVHLASLLLLFIIVLVRTPFPLCVPRPLLTPITPVLATRSSIKIRQDEPYADVTISLV